MTAVPASRYARPRTAVPPPGREALLGIGLGLLVVFLATSASATSLVPNRPSATPPAPPRGISTIATSSAPQAPAASSSPGTWVNVTDSVGPAPSPRSGAALGYDAADQEMVLFGGAAPGPNGNLRVLGDTWTFKGGVWTNITSTLSISPPARAGGKMVYDSSDGYLLMFGAESPDEPYGPTTMNDTWSFVGGQWTPRADFPCSGFQYGLVTEMTYDAHDGYVLLTGNTAGCSLASGYGSTWSYHAGQWTLESIFDPGLSPSDPMTYVSEDGHAVQFGGNFTYSPWSYLDGAWTSLPSSSTGEPSFEGEQPFVDDPALGYAVMTEITPWSEWFPNFFPTLGAVSTWGYVGDNWTNLTPTTSASPSMRFAPSYAYDPDSADLVLFAGSSQPTSGYLNDTWEFVASPSNSSSLSVNASASTLSGAAPLTVEFWSSVTGGVAPYTYNWDENFQWFAGVQDPTFTFSQPGTYLVNVTVQDSDFHAAVSPFITLTVTGTSGLSVVASDSASSGEAPLTVEFWSNVSGGGAPYAYQWVASDASTTMEFSTAADSTFNFTEEGTYTVQVQVTNDSRAKGWSNALSVTVDPLGPLVAQILASPTSGPAPLTVEFTSSVTGGTAPYLDNWSFGDGSSMDATSDPIHTYSTVGAYDVVLNVTDAAGEETVAGVQILVRANGTGSSGGALGVSIAVDPASGPAPLDVTLQGSAIGGSGPYTYSWNFGDGSTSSQADTAHVYDGNGTFMASFSVVDSEGAIAWASAWIGVSGDGEPGELPVPVLTTVGALTAGVPVSFDVGLPSESTAYQLAWEFGDGTSALSSLKSGGSETPAMQHTFSLPGRYNVTLVARLPGGKPSGVGLVVDVTPAALSSHVAPATPSATVIGGVAAVASALAVVAGTGYLRRRRGKERKAAIQAAAGAASAVPAQFPQLPPPPSPPRFRPREF